MIENQEDKTKRFLNGLRIDICEQLVPLNIKDYNELYAWARPVEQELIRRRQRKDIKPSQVAKSRMTTPRNHPLLPTRDIILKVMGKVGIAGLLNEYHTRGVIAVETRKKHGNTLYPSPRRCFGCG